MAKQKIFFSYSRVDGSAYALKLAGDLRAKGFDVWIDQEDIRAGLDWDTEIENALKSCDCLLFLETEKSVASKNVLDEVYYAIEQNKKVIPLIFVDSKTPYRLNRLQHIDFSKNYETGLAQLAKELEGKTAVTEPIETTTPPSGHEKPLPAKNYRTLWMIAGLALLIAAAVALTTSNKDAAPAESSEVVGTNGDGSDFSESQKEKAESDAGNMDDLVAGDWQLMEVQPTAKSQNGYLKIDALGENKASIKAYMQFYYPGNENPPYLTVFNSFVGCASCELKKEMKLRVEDIAIGSANSNKSIRGKATLQFVDSGTAVIRVSRQEPAELANDVKLEPFEYTFRFKKAD